MSVRNRLPQIAGVFREDLPLLRANARDPKKDYNGCSSAALQGALRFLGVANYVLNGDVDAFKTSLHEVAEIGLNLFRRYEEGEPIDDSFVAMLAYKDLFNALASGDVRLAESLAAYMGGRAMLEKKHDHPFDYTLGYTLRAFVLNDLPEMTHWVSSLATVCHEAENSDFFGYVVVFESILQSNATKANEGLKTITQGHGRQAKKSGVFVNKEDEVLCVWGVGMANLSRSRGLEIRGVSPLIPADLLM